MVDSRLNAGTVSQRERGIRAPLFLISSTYYWEGAKRVSVVQTENDKPVLIKHRSVSQYTTFVRCGEAYRLEKVVKAPSTPAAWFAQGTAFHAAIELWERSDREITPADIHARFDTVWYEEMAKNREKQPDVSKWLTGGRTKPENDVTNRYAKGHSQIDGYLAHAVKAPWHLWEFFPGEKAIELPFTLQLGEVEVIGFIDQVVEYPDGSLRVRDLKTGTKLPDTALQLGVYALALQSQLDEEVGWGDFYMAKNNEPTDPYDLSYYTRERLTRWFGKMDAAVKAGTFLPNPGDSCRVCTVRPYCDAGGPLAHEFPPE